MRLKLIDIARGTSIILVAFSHSHLMREIPQLNHALALFRMPLFFFLSGVFFKEIVSFRKVLGSKTDTLLKPYFLTLFAAIIYMADTNNLNEPWSAIAGIFYGNGHTIPLAAFVPLWFLTHLWFLYVFIHALFSVTKIQSRHVIWQVVFVVFLLTTGTWTIKLFWMEETAFPGLPFSLDLALISAAFFSAGRFLQKQVKAFIPNLAILLIALSGWLLIGFGTNASVDLNQRIYTNPLFGTIGASMGIYLILSFSYYVQTFSPLTSFLRYAGESSLFILIFHCFFESKIYYLLLPAQKLPGFITSIIAFLACISIPLVIREIVRRNDYLALAYLPLKKNNRLLIRLGFFKSAEPGTNVDYLLEDRASVGICPPATAQAEHTRSL